MRVENKNAVLEGLKVGGGEEFKKHVVFSIMTTENAEGILEKIPYRRHLDFVVYYQLFFADEKQGEDYVRIDNEIAEKMDVSEQNLYDLAMENTEKQLGLHVETFQALDPIGIMKTCRPMKVIFNHFGKNASAYILLTNVLKDVADEFRSDILLTISTTYEIVVFQVDKENNDLAENLLSASRNVIELGDVDAEDLMTGSVYIYKQKTGDVELLLDAKEREM